MQNRILDLLEVVHKYAFQPRVGAYKIYLPSGVTLMISRPPAREIKIGATAFVMDSNESLLDRINNSKSSIQGLLQKPGDGFWVPENHIRKELVLINETVHWDEPASDIRAMICPDIKNNNCGIYSLFRNWRHTYAGRGIYYTTLPTWWDLEFRPTCPFLVRQTGTMRAFFIHVLNMLVDHTYPILYGVSCDIDIEERKRSIMANIEAALLARLGAYCNDPERTHTGILLDKYLNRPEVLPRRLTGLMRVGEGVKA